MPPLVPGVGAGDLDGDEAAVQPNIGLQDIEGGVAEKTPADSDSIAWNHHLGGSFENIHWKEWPGKACLEGIKACVSLGLDFGGIDIIEDSDGTPYVLEGNSAPSMTSEYRQRCFAKCFNYIRENGKERIHISKPPNDKKDTYPWLIHPAVAEEARIP